MNYEVNVVYKGQINYLVEADSPEEAEEMALERWHNGDRGETLGTEWQSCEKTIVSQVG